MHLLEQEFLTCGTCTTRSTSALSKGVHSRVAMKKKNIFTYYLFPNIYTYISRSVTRGRSGGESPPKKFPLEKCFGHSSNTLGPSRKTLRPSCCPKLVTGLHISEYYCQKPLHTYCSELQTSLILKPEPGPSPKSQARTRPESYIYF